ncbi:MAG TPA: hypothetical protein ACYCC3_01255 [Candidatus Azoamicus sp.]
MNILKGIMILTTIIFSLSIILIIYLPRNKKKIENYSNIPFEDTKIN